MRKAILMLLLVVVAAPASAAWVKAGEAGIVSYYIDPATIRKTGNFSQVRQVHDFEDMQKGGEMSWQGLMEYDCKEGRYRLLEFAEYSEPMLGGKKLKSSDYQSRWAAVPPDTVNADILKDVCAK
jgi:hypothetical protein